ncbi:MAG TPA: hypothetical protein VFB99_12495, partial [Vicinamibacterales bacterium]|nr:hypothetical protein [Vicinamibacterales bacterium]
GHPIALLEAASFGVPILASAIPANLVVPLPRERFFPVGRTEVLAQLMRSAAARCVPGDAECQRILDAIRTRYSWRNAARLTRSAYSFASSAPQQAGILGRDYG